MRAPSVCAVSIDTLLESGSQKATLEPKVLCSAEGEGESDSVQQRPVEIIAMQCNITHTPE